MPLGPADVRRLADRLGVRPTKTLGQNFVHDAGTVRRVVRAAGVVPGDFVLEVGPGLGSLTLALLEAGAHVTAVEIDAVLAAALPDTVATFLPEAVSRLAVLHADALRIPGPAALPVPESLRADGDRATAPPDGDHATTPPDGDRAAAPSARHAPTPTKLVANLPYNVATPVLLTLLEVLPDLTDVLVMVQAEVADRLAEPPGSRTYGAPTAKVAWYGTADRAGSISRTVFWPVPNVDSALVRITRTAPPETTATRSEVFEVIDAAFAQRRKTLRAALAEWAGGAAEAERLLRAAGIDPARRGETLHIREFARIAAARSAAENPAAGPAGPSAHPADAEGRAPRPRGTLDA